MELQLPAVLAANRIYQYTGFHRAPRTAEPSRRLVVLTCMDARLDVFGALGLEMGQAHILRNAGGRASADAVRSLVVSAHLLGTREVGVIHHTDCGLEGRTKEEVAERTGVRGVDFLAFGDVEKSVRQDVDVIRRCGYLPAGFVSWGAVYDVETGALEIVSEPDAG